MSRLVAYIANDPQRIRCALHPGRDALLVNAGSPEAVIDSWGFGFHSGDEVLLQRRPKPTAGPLDFYELLGDLRSDVLIGHMRKATVGAIKNENTQPFRFRSWVFAHHGTVGGTGARFEAVRARVLAAVPDFLQRNIRGETDSELLFHVFLGQLHKANKLDDAQVSPEAAGRALAETIALCDHAVGDGSSTLDVAASNGRILVAVTRGAPMHYYQISGIRDCPVCRESPLDTTRTLARPFEHEHLRAVVLVADEAMGAPRPPWIEIPQGSLVTVTHALQIEITPLAK